MKDELDVFKDKPEDDKKLWFHYGLQHTHALELYVLS